MTSIILTSPRSSAKVEITETAIYASPSGPMEYIGYIEKVAHGFKVEVYTVTYEPVFTTVQEAMRYCVDSVFTRMIEVEELSDCDECSEPAGACDRECSSYEEA